MFYIPRSRHYLFVVCSEVKSYITNDQSHHIAQIAEMYNLCEEELHSLAEVTEAAAEQASSWSSPGGRGSGSGDISRSSGSGPAGFLRSGGGGRNFGDTGTASAADELLMHLSSSSTPPHYQQHQDSSAAAMAAARVFHQGRGGQAGRVVGHHGQQQQLFGGGGATGDGLGGGGGGGGFGSTSMVGRLAGLCPDYPSAHSGLSAQM